MPDPRTQLRDWLMAVAGAPRSFLSPDRAAALADSVPAADLRDAATLFRELLSTEILDGELGAVLRSCACTFARHNPGKLDLNAIDAPVSAAVRNCLEAWLRAKLGGKSVLPDLRGAYFVVATKRACRPRRKADREPMSSLGEADEHPAPTPEPFEELSAEERRGEVLDALRPALPQLSPDQRAAFVLGDLYAAPADFIAWWMGKSSRAPVDNLRTRARRKLGEVLSPDAFFGGQENDAIAAVAYAVLADGEFARVPCVGRVAIGAASGAIRLELRIGRSGVDDQRLDEAWAIAAVIGDDGEERPTKPFALRWSRGTQQSRVAEVEVPLAELARDGLALAGLWVFEGDWLGMLEA